MEQQSECEREGAKMTLRFWPEQMKEGSCHLLLLSKGRPQSSRLGVGFGGATE